MGKLREYYPSYQLRPNSTRCADELDFRYQGVYFTTKRRGFGMTETQRAALSWAGWNRTAPVVSIKHDQPTKPDKENFGDPTDLHRHYYPYAMSIATIQCLGEEKPRQIKIYFCEVWLHEDNMYTKNHHKSREAYVEEIS